jgi:hypothetical protein
MEKYFDSALLIATVGLLIHLHVCVHDLKKRLKFHIDKHHNVYGAEEEDHATR